MRTRDQVGSLYSEFFFARHDCSAILSLAVDRTEGRIFTGGIQHRDDDNGQTWVGRSWSVDGESLSPRGDSGELWLPVGEMPLEFAVGTQNGWIVPGLDELLLYDRRLTAIIDRLVCPGDALFVVPTVEGLVAFSEDRYFVFTDGCFRVGTLGYEYRCGAAMGRTVFLVPRRWSNVIHSLHLDSLDSLPKEEWIVSGHIHSIGCQQGLVVTLESDTDLFGRADQNRYRVAAYHYADLIGAFLLDRVDVSLGCSALVTSDQWIVHLVDSTVRVLRGGSYVDWMALPRADWSVDLMKRRIPCREVMKSPFEEFLDWSDVLF